MPTAITHLTTASPQPTSSKSSCASSSSGSPPTSITTYPCSSLQLTSTTSTTNLNNHHYRRHTNERQVGRFSILSASPEMSGATNSDRLARVFNFACVTNTNEATKDQHPSQTNLPSAMKESAATSTTNPLTREDAPTPPRLSRSARQLLLSGITATATSDSHSIQDQPDTVVITELSPRVASVVVSPMHQHLRVASSRICDRSPIAPPSLQETQERPTLGSLVHKPEKSVGIGAVKSHQRSHTSLPLGQSATTLEYHPTRIKTRSSINALEGMHYDGQHAMVVKKEEEKSPKQQLRSRLNSLNASTSSSSTTIAATAIISSLSPNVPHVEAVTIPVAPSKTIVQEKPVEPSVDSSHRIRSTFSSSPSQPRLLPSSSIQSVNDVTVGDELERDQDWCYYRRMNHQRRASKIFTFEYSKRRAATAASNGANASTIAQMATQ